MKTRKLSFANILLAFIVISALIISVLVTYSLVRFERAQPDMFAAGAARDEVIGELPGEPQFVADYPPVIRPPQISISSSRPGVIEMTEHDGSIIILNVYEFEQWIENWLELNRINGAADEELAMLRTRYSRVLESVRTSVPERTENFHIEHGLYWGIIERINSGEMDYYALKEWIEMTAEQYRGYVGDEVIEAFRERYSHALENLRIAAASAAYRSDYYAPHIITYIPPHYVPTLPAPTIVYRQPPPDYLALPMPSFAPPPPDCVAAAVFAPRQRMMTMDEARRDPVFGAYIPSNIPYGFTAVVDGATYIYGDNLHHGDNLFLYWYKESEFIHDGKISRHSDGISWTIVRAEDFNSDIFHFPVFAAEELTLDVVRRAAHWITTVVLPPPDRFDAEAVEALLLAIDFGVLYSSDGNNTVIVVLNYMGNLSSEPDAHIELERTEQIWAMFSGF